MDQTQLVFNNYFETTQNILKIFEKIDLVAKSMMSEISDPTLNELDQG